MMIIPCPILVVAREDVHSKMGCAVSVLLIPSNLGHFLIIIIFMGSGWPMFSENTLIFFNQQDVQLGPAIFCEMATGDRSKVAQTSK